jgi:hypothetical protein
MLNMIAMIARALIRVLTLVPIALFFIELSFLQSAPKTFTRPALSACIGRQSELIASDSSS